MMKKWNINMGLLSMVVVSCLMTVMLGNVAFATEPPALDPMEEIQEESESMPIEGSAGQEESEPHEPEEEITPPNLEDSILLNWEVDSSLVYLLTDDNFVWEIYNSDGQVLPENDGTAASAGFIQTSKGTWYGAAIITLTLTNKLDTEAQLRLLFQDSLSESAVAISETIVADQEGVRYDAETGTLVIQPGATGVAQMTIHAHVLQQAGVTVTEADSTAGWIQVQVVSPRNSNQAEPEPETVEPPIDQNPEQTETEATEPDPSIDQNPDQTGSDTIETDEVLTIDQMGETALPTQPPEEEQNIA